MARSRGDSSSRTKTPTLRKTLVMVVAFLFVAALVSVVSTSTSRGAPLPEFSNPSAIVVSHSRVWVANYGNNTITEFNSTNGSLVRIIADPADKIDGPNAMAIEGHDLWIADVRGYWVTELNTKNGSLIRVIKNPTDQINQPSDVAINDGHLWILSQGVGIITELQPSDNALVRLVGGNADLVFPSYLAFTGDNMWVAGDAQLLADFNTTTGAEVTTPLSKFPGGNGEAIASDAHFIWMISPTGVLTEFNASTFVALRSLYSELQSYGGAPSILRGDVWVLASDNKVLEYDEVTGSLVRALKIPANNAYYLNATGSHVWIAYPHSIRELNASNGTLVRVIQKK
jgi:hypothetical protein